MNLMALKATILFLSRLKTFNAPKEKYANDVKLASFDIFIAIVGIKQKCNRLFPRMYFANDVFIYLIIKYVVSKSGIYLEG